MSDERRIPDDPTSRLVEAGRGVAEVPEIMGNRRAALANALVGLKAKYYGKGPTGAKTYIADRNVFVVMEGGLTANEQVLLADDKADQVRSFRLSFQETVGDTAIRAVEEILGRTVLSYHSQIVFDPTYVLEWFVLDEPVQDVSEAN